MIGQLERDGLIDRHTDCSPQDRARIRVVQDRGRYVGTPSRK